MQRPQKLLVSPVCFVCPAARTLFNSSPNVPLLDIRILVKKILPGPVHFLSHSSPRTQNRSIPLRWVARHTSPLIQRTQRPQKKPLMLCSYVTYRILQRGLDVKVNSWRGAAKTAKRYKSQKSAAKVLVSRVCLVYLVLSRLSSFFSLSGFSGLSR